LDIKGLMLHKVS